MFALTVVPIVIGLRKNTGSSQGLPLLTNDEDINLALHIQIHLGTFQSYYTCRHHNVLVTRSAHISYMYSSWTFDSKLVEFSSERVRSSILHRQSIESEIRLRSASKNRFDEKYVLWGYLSCSNILAN